jgi:CRISPR type IV-associated protein Csf2
MQVVQATNSYRFEGIARALSAISHLGDSTGGTISVFRREKMVIDGQVQEIPVLSGNAFRGLLRDCGMRFMLRELGEPVLSPAAFHFLTSGGALTKDAGRGLDIGQARRLRELIPLVGIFGGACGRQILEGKLQVGKWYPVCRELASYLPEQYQGLPEMQQSIFDMTDLHSFTRTDDAKSESWQKNLPAPQRALLEAPKVKISKDGTEIAEKGVAQQMRYSQEVLIAGTRFYLWLNLNDVTDLEKASFASALYEWSCTPFVGGQARHGCGLIELDLKNWVEIKPLARVEGLPVDVSPSNAYVRHLQEHKDDILEALQEIS